MMSTNPAYVLKGHCKMIKYIKLPYPSNNLILLHYTFCPEMDLLQLNQKQDVTVHKQCEIYLHFIHFIVFCH